MLTSIYIGISGLNGYSDGLRVIANNTANMNTPGFKGSTLQFSDLFYDSDNVLAGNKSGGGQLGFGLDMSGTKLNFQQGDLRQTGNDLDAAVNGQGLFVLKDTSGKLHYTRAGQFEFNSQGYLVDRVSGNYVMTFDPNNALSRLSINDARVSSAKATTTVKFDGNLSSAATTQAVNGVTIFDSAGGQHNLTLQLANTSATTAGSWSVTLMDGATTVGTGQLVFNNGTPVQASSTVTMTYTPAGLGPIPLVLDFGTNVTSFAAGNLSTLAMTSQDGYAPSGLTQATFDNTGALSLTYANGQTIRGPRLALARFDSIDAVASEGGNEFAAVDQKAWHLGAAGTGSFGSINAKMIEGSNVDLSQEFSDLVIMQRGYQASSQIVSTANDMLQELFAMKGK